MTYPLYQTFKTNIPDKDLPAKDKKKLSDVVDNLDEDQKIAMIRLILEHATLEGDISPDQGLQSLPYGGDLVGDEKTPQFKIAKLPIRLRWILWKFTEVVLSSQPQ